MQKTNLLDESFLKINNRQALINEFNKPIFQNRIFINKQFLILNSNKYEFDRDSWVYNPQRFAFEIYKEFEYYRVILLVNDIGSIMQFSPNRMQHSYIIAPYQSRIDNLLN